MNIKGQGALEYLLLIGGAVLVAAIVIALVTGIPGSTPDPGANVRCANHSQFAVCNADVGFVSGAGTWDCVAKQIDGLTDATAQADMGSCVAVSA